MSERTRGVMTAMGAQLANNAALTGQFVMYDRGRDGAKNPVALIYLNGKIAAQVPFRVEYIVPAPDILFDVHVHYTPHALAEMLMHMRVRKDMAERVLNNGPQVGEKELAAYLRDAANQAIAVIELLKAYMVDGDANATELRNRKQPSPDPKVDPAWGEIEL